MGDSFGGYTASALRSVLVLIILMPIALVYRALEPIDFKQNGRYMAGLIVASAFTWGPLYYAILHAGVGISLAVMYGSSVISTFFFGWLFAGERFTVDKALAALLGIAGLGLIFSPSTAHLGWLALVAALISGLSVGVNSVLSKKIHYGATQSTIALWTASVIANVPMAFVFHESLPDIGWHLPWLYLGFFAVASIAASWLFIKGVKLIEAGAAGVLGLLEIVFGVLIGVAFFHERPATLVLLGVGLIIAAAAIPYVKDYNARRGTLE